MVIVVRSTEVVEQAVGAQPWIVGHVQQVLDGDNVGWLEVHEWGNGEYGAADKYYPLYKGKETNKTTGELEDKDWYRKGNKRMPTGFSASLTHLHIDSVLAYGTSKNMWNASGKLSKRAIDSAKAHFSFV